ncbi:MAG: glycosyltransferase [Candidatus Omnitrophica bacterium]|nr:glycosyltransferase [Candidatus Omnitrophota bacterium]
MKSGEGHYKINNPKVSVLISLYNYGQYLQEAVESVEKQTCADWEIIIVDDCSTDKSLSVAMELERRLGGRLRLIRNSTNQGVARTRNIAIEAARGRYIAFLDADDRWHPKKLQMQMELFETKDNPPDIVHTGIKTFADSDITEWLRKSRGPARDPEYWDLCFNDRFLKTIRKNKGDYFDLFCHNNPTCFSSFVVKREVLSSVGGFDEGLFHQSEDWLLWLKASLFFQFHFIPDKLTYYRIHRRSYTLRVYVSPEYDHEVNRGQVRDRCLIFARRKGLKLSYGQFESKKSILKYIAKYILRKMRR